MSELRGRGVSEAPGTVGTQGTRALSPDWKAKPGTLRPVIHAAGLWVPGEMGVPFGLDIVA